jgi:D-alanyl-D-alanine carboxypeptidase
VRAIPAKGSWWDAPAGLYQVVALDEDFYSNIAQATFPSAVVFEENFVIHGTPRLPDGTAVDSAFSAGGIRVSDAAAADLYEAVVVGTPVLIYREEPTRDTFVYRPSAPAVSAEQYFVADLESNTVLAASANIEPVPIASITKLMTAVIAAEEMSLDERVQVASPNFVTSLVPRLAGRNSVSMYSLLQLILVESSNEASEVLATEFGREEFIAAMNAKARQLGMLNTSFADPSGLSSENISSVGDLFILTQYIRNSRQFIFDLTRDASLATAYQGGDFSGLQNFNEIDDVTGFVGGKVGETRAAGQTSVSLHEIEIDGVTRTIAVIVLGSAARSDDVRTLVSFIEQQFGG